MSGRDRQSFEGRLMRKKEKDGAVYLVASVAGGSRPGKPSVLAVRISPLPAAFERIPLGDLVEDLDAPPPSGLSALAHLVSRALSGSGSTEGAVFSANTIFKPYQFRPLLKYLRSDAKRILIADEAGLGKTVEAGYIIVEDIARYKGSRILVLCPPGLRRKWRADMLRHFGLGFEVVQGTELATRLEGTGPFRLIASFDSARLRRGDGPHPPWSLDLLVIDEVHHMIGRTGEILRRRLGQEASQASKRAVALSATPIHLEFDDLRRVLEVVLGAQLDPSAFGRDMDAVRALNAIRQAAQREQPLSTRDARRLPSPLANAGVPREKLEKIIALAQGGAERRGELETELRDLDPFQEVLTRSRRRDVNEFRARKIEDHWVELAGREEGEDTSEHEVFEAADALLKASFTHVHRLQLASSLPATIDLLRGGMRGFRVWVRGREVFGELDREDRQLAEAASPYRKQLSAVERDQCSKIVDMSARLTLDSKWMLLKSLLVSAMELRPRKAVVFTQWVPTLRYLRERSQGLQGFAAFSISGEDPDWQRDRTLNAFAKHQGPAVLFATDILSEGVDLQWADTVYNYDSPTNPQRIEQRIGRVDRVGQRSETVEVHNLWTAETIDEEVAAWVRARIKLFEEGIGDVTVVTGEAAAAYGRPPDKEVEDRLLGQLRELNSVGIFAAAEGFLDSQAYELRARQSGALHRFCWAPVSRLLLQATGRRAVALDDGDSVRVGPVDELSLDVVKRWVGVSNSAAVESELRSNQDDQGYVRIAKSPGKPGLFCSPATPLGQLSFAITIASEEPLDASRANTPLRFSAPGLEQTVAVCRYSWESQDRRELITTYWAADDVLTIKLAGEQLRRVQDVLDRAGLVELRARENWEAPPALEEVMRRDFETWLKGVGGKASGAGATEWMALLELKA